MSWKMADMKLPRICTIQIKQKVLRAENVSFNGLYWAHKYFKKELSTNQDEKVS